MDYMQCEDQISTQEVVDLDEKFIKELETEEVILERGEDMNIEKYSLCYVVNSIELLNERYNYLKYDPKVDIIKDEYEGGFKLWEGTNDLLNFIFENGEKFDLNNKNVLDLGCGSGLIGIFCLKAFDVKSVCFQDYNLEVLKFATLPNIVKNDAENQIPKCRFIAGDWSATVEKISNNTNDIITKLHNEQGSTTTTNKFHAIFMSEVLYSVENYPKLGNIISNLLEEDGVCVISSKLYYFGVNGSVDEFKEFMQNNYPNLKIQVLKEINNKKSNKRELFSLQNETAKVS